MAENVETLLQTVTETVEERPRFVPENVETLQ